MVDHVPKDRRSWLMSQVRGKDTSPEMSVRQVAHQLGLRFRLHRKDLPGRPDLVFPKHKLCIFVHGCFWHRHQGCKKCSTPKTNAGFWLEKFDRNVLRDRDVTDKLLKLGWNVQIIWECETKDRQYVAELIRSNIKMRT